MYQSRLDALGKLEFPFDPLRALHARSDSKLQWPEYPYKQVAIDRVRSKSGSHPLALSVEAAAGALLIALGEETGALFEVEQRRPREDNDDADSDNWKLLERRFTDERAAFQAAKRAYLLEQKRKVQSKLDGIEAQRRAVKEKEAHDAWRRRQIVKRFDDGSKYDGDGVCTNNVLVPHGHGTLWVPQTQQLVAASISEVKRRSRYTGEWMNGFMHGKGTYYWDNGDSWTGHFLRDELEGKGVYTLAYERHSNDDDDDADNDDDDGGYDARQGATIRARERVRYFSASQHVCWGHELVRGCRLVLFTNRHYGHALATAPAHCDSSTENKCETEVVLVSYNAANDTHVVRVCGTEDTKSISLHNVSFRVVPGQPVARFESD